MYGWLTFYHQGHEVAKDFKSFSTDLQKKLQKASDPYVRSELTSSKTSLRCISRDEIVEQINVASLRDAGKARMTSIHVNRHNHQQVIRTSQTIYAAILQHVQDTIDIPTSTRTIIRRLIVSDLHLFLPLRGCGSPVVKVSNHGRHVMSSIPVPLKTRRVGQRCTLNLSRAETSSRWCGVVVRRGGCQLRCRPRHLTMVQNYVVRRQKPSCS
ncbi:uncharacterized protein TNCV_2781441 [Trichonephila clavipes]|nr:uncharacterized protein TNCV_2781441 [Trichonephila clavipes]